MASLNIDLPQKQPKKQEPVQNEKRESFEAKRVYDEVSNALDESLLEEMVKEEGMVHGI